MPTGYAGEGKIYSKKLGKWLPKEKNQAFDYDNVEEKSVALIISFFRWYPDYFADLCRDEKAKYKLELPQRIMMRIFARYRNAYITGVRGLTKTYIVLLSNMIEGILFPGHIVRYTAPNQKQAASLAAKAFHEIEKSYPIITQMWNVRNDRQDMFRITTVYGSEFTMYAPRGDTAGACIGEECGQEGENAFPIDDFLKDIYPIVRDNRTINQKTDYIHINQKHHHIGNACSKQNKAYTELRGRCLNDMLFEEKYEGYVIDISWITALLGNIRDIKYFKDLKKTLTSEDWLRECCARYTGSESNPLISDKILAESRRLKSAEFSHCEKENVTYIVSHDVSYANGRHNAKCADAVIKLIPYENTDKRDKYKAQLVFIDAYSPPKTAYLQAQKIKNLWEKFCNSDCGPTYLVIDAQAYGTEIVEELMKPSEDASPCLCCINHMKFTEIEQPNSIPVIYPLKAGGRGTADEDGLMIKYAQSEFEQGNVDLLTANTGDGLTSYKSLHGIKDDFFDGKIRTPYDFTDELCQQINNIRIKVSGFNNKEERKSKAIQRDMWSALKYALRLKQILENEKSKEKYKQKSSWSAFISKQNPLPSNSLNTNTRSRLLSMRRR